MDVAPVGIDPPRPPLFERITPTQWVAVDIVLAGLFMLAALGHLYRGLDLGAHHWSEWVLTPLYVMATLPVAIRRRWPELSLICITVAVAVAAILGYSLAPVPLIAFPLYSVTVKYSRRQSLMVLVAVEALFIVVVGVSAILRPVQGDVTFNILLAVVIWFWGDSVRNRRAYRAGLARQSEQEQRRALDRAHQATVEERLEIARELHDVIAHSLSVIAIQSGVGRHVIDTQPDEAKKALEAVEHTSRSALDELRRVLGALRRSAGGSPELSPAPTLADLDDLISTVQAAGVPVELRLSGDFEPVASGLEQSIYRIVQEALTNVVKHTHGAPTSVTISSTPDCLVLEVVNAASAPGGPTPDSRGAGRNGHAEMSDHHGIIGMKERAIAFGGSLVASSLPDGGFRVFAELPYRDRP